MSLVSAYSLGLRVQITTLGLGLIKWISGVTYCRS
jgi:hypothetical protein